MVSSPNQTQRNKKERQRDTWHLTPVTACCPALVVTGQRLMQIQFIMADPLKCDWVLIDSWWSQSSGGNLRSIKLHHRLGCVSSGKTVKPAAASKTIQLENGEQVAVVWYSMMESHTIHDCSLGPIYFRITQRCRQPEIYYELRFYVDFRLHHTWKCNWNMTLIKRFVKNLH